MNPSRVIVFLLAVAGCAAAACSIARRRRGLQKRQLEEGWHAWEDEGGNLAPPADQQSRLENLSPSQRARPCFRKLLRQP